MTTQATKCTLHNANNSKALLFTKTNTDDAWGEMVDSVDSLSLYDKLKGTTVTHFTGNYTAGAGIFRIRNTVTSEIKALECLDMVKGATRRPLLRPVLITDNDVLEVFTTVAGS